MRDTRAFSCFLLTAALAAGWVASTEISHAQDKKGKTRDDAKAAAAMIDARIDQAIYKAGLQPAPLAVKENIVRRLSLDLNGVIPTTHTLVSFVNSKSDDKYAELIDAMIEAPDFDRHWADVFSSAWIGRKMRRGSGQFRSWLKEQLSKRRPFDAVVRDVIAAQGALDENGAVFFTFRWETSPTDVAAQSARVFMGLQIQCAQCHDHPFTEWKQEQFHHFAAYFNNMRRGNKKKGDQNIPTLMKRNRGVYRYKIKSTGMEKAFNPKFLFDFEGTKKSTESRDLRRAVANLMTHPENPYFARMTVNRVWKAMFGRGLVEPTEDLEGNDGYHPMLLQFLAEDFIQSGFDLRHLVRTVAMSRAYKRSSKRPKNQKDPAADFEKVAKSKNKEKREAAALKAQQEVWLFARGSIRPLTPEQIAISMLRATVAPMDPKNSNEQYDKKWQNLRRQLVRQFDQLFGEGEAANPDSFDGTIPQSLIMLNGKFVNEAIKAQKGTRMANILRGNKDAKTVVKTIFLAVLSRRPTKAEARAFTRYIKAQGASTQTYEDLMWALMNSSEFLMNH